MFYFIVDCFGVNFAYETYLLSIVCSLALPIDLRKSVRQHHLESRLDNRPTRDDLVQRNILRIFSLFSSPGSHFTPVFANQASELERRIKEARVNQSLLKRPELHELIERNIQSNASFLSFTSEYKPFSLASIQSE